MRRFQFRMQRAACHAHKAAATSGRHKRVKAAQNAFATSSSLATATAAATESIAVVAVVTFVISGSNMLPTVSELLLLLLLLQWQINLFVALLLQVT